jgi:hypothetical protein
MAAIGTSRCAPSMEANSVSVSGVRAVRSIADMLVKAWKVTGTLSLPPLSNAITGAIYKMNADTMVILMSFFIEQSSLN